MSKNILSLLSLNTNTVDNTIDTTQESVMSEISTPTATENPMRILNIVTVLIVLDAITSCNIGYQHAITVNGSPADPFFGFNMINTAVLSFVGLTTLGIALILAWHYARKALATLGIIALTILATPASAFAQAVTLESDMVSTVTTSVIANAFTTLILAAFVAGAFTGIYTIIAKNRKAFQFGVTAVFTLVGAAFIIALAGMLLPYTTTGYVAQDMVAISMFSAIVLYTGMTAVVWRADVVLTNSEKAKIAVEKARVAAAEAAHQAEIDSVNEIARLIDTLRIMAEFTEGKYMKNVVCPTLSSKLDWKNGVNRARYMGHWPSDK